MYEFAVTPAVTQIRRRGVEIAEVAAGSLGAELELEPGDRVMSVNGRTVRDYLDFRFQTAGETEMVVDVRKPSEWAISHMKDAKFIPLSDMPVNLAGLDKNKCYYVHCGGGYRSMTAISLMKREGFKELHNVQGGFRAMMDAGLKIVTEEVPA